MNEDIRQFALQMANNHHEHPEQVVERAEAYMAFLDPPASKPKRQKEVRNYSPASREAAAERMRKLHQEGRAGRKPKLVA